MKKTGLFSSAAVVGLLTAALGAPGAARAVDAADDAPRPPSSQASNQANTVQEVIITGEKKVEKLIDAPLSVTVLSPDKLESRGLNSIDDYFSSIPGLNLEKDERTPGQLSIRGLSNAISGNSTTAVVVDDVPFGHSSGLIFGGPTIPDFDPSDLQQIEVLKGPQGTLYGSAALGGLVRFVTRDPSVSGFSGRVEAGILDNPAGGLGYVTRAAVNIPLSSTFAVRASAFGRQDPGYIDNVTTGQKNLNALDVEGAHIVALWVPNSNVSLKLSATAQYESSDGQNRVTADKDGNFILGGYKDTGILNFDKNWKETRIYSADLKARWHGVLFESITGYTYFNAYESADYTNYFSSTYYGPQYIGAPNILRVGDARWSQEFHASSSLWGRLDWFLGAFATQENAKPMQNRVYAEDPTTNVIAGTATTYDDGPMQQTEQGVFGNATLHVTKKFSIQFGARESWYGEKYSAVYTGPVYYPTPFVQAQQTVQTSAFTYLIDPKYQFTPDLTVYARIATGYRVGGPNFFDYAFTSVAPRSYGPDTTINYELGFKGNFFDHRLALAVSIYHIDWNKLQTDVSVPVVLGGISSTTDYITNVGDAKSEGVELEVQAHPIRGMTITAQGSYDNAAITQGLPYASTAYAPRGTKLPFAMPVSGGFTIDQDVPLGESWTGSVGASFTYVGARYEYLSSSSTDPRLRAPSYSTFDLRASARHNGWLASLYMRNVTNSRGIITINYGGEYGNTGNYDDAVVQPRTIGLSLSKTF
jgi:outer membrane receptor protein involved in Fe transport